MVGLESHPKEWGLVSNGGLGISSQRVGIGE